MIAFCSAAARGGWIPDDEESSARRLLVRQLETPPDLELIYQTEEYGTKVRQLEDQLHCGDYTIHAYLAGIDFPTHCALFEVLHQRLSGDASIDFVTDHLLMDLFSCEESYYCDDPEDVEELVRAVPRTKFRRADDELGSNFTLVIQPTDNTLDAYGCPSQKLVADHAHVRGVSIQAVELGFRSDPDCLDDLMELTTYVIENFDRFERDSVEWQRNFFVFWFSIELLLAIAYGIWWRWQQGLKENAAHEYDEFIVKKDKKKRKKKRRNKKKKHHEEEDEVDEQEGESFEFQDMKPGDEAQFVNPVTMAETRDCSDTEPSTEDEESGKSSSTTSSQEERPDSPPPKPSVWW